MIGQDAIGFHGVGEGITASAAPLVYNPISRVIAGGFSNGRPVQVATLTIIDYVQWDDDSFILWDDDSGIEWDE